MELIKKFKDALSKSKKIVVFSGAGLSTNSGIPDFRSANGIYNQKTNYTLSAEEIISHSFFMSDTDEFYKFYFDKMVYPNAKPNSAHIFFAKLESLGYDVKVVTQNIDDLHQMAGSSDVVELHGSIKRNYCMRCNKFYSLEEILVDSKTPRCQCGGIIKPDVVLYEEGLKPLDIQNAINYISNCDMLIVIGTSLMVYPAAGFIRYFKGDNLVLINKTETQYDNIANIVIHDDIKTVIEKIEGKAD